LKILSRNNDTLLHIAAKQSTECDVVAIILYLLTQGLSIDDKDQFGNSPIDMCEDVWVAEMMRIWPRTITSMPNFEQRRQIRREFKVRQVSREDMDKCIESFLRGTEGWMRYKVYIIGNNPVAKASLLESMTMEILGNHKNHRNNRENWNLRHNIDGNDGCEIDQRHDLDGKKGSENNIVVNDQRRKLDDKGRSENSSVVNDQGHKLDGKKVSENISVVKDKKHKLDGKEGSENSSVVNDKRDLQRMLIDICRKLEGRRSQKNRSFPITPPDTKLVEREQIARRRLSSLGVVLTERSSLANLPSLQESAAFLKLSDVEGMKPKTSATVPIQNEDAEDFVPAAVQFESKVATRKSSMVLDALTQISSLTATPMPDPTILSSPECEAKQMKSIEKKMNKMTTEIIKNQSPIEDRKHTVANDPFSIVKTVPLKNEIAERSVQLTMMDVSGQQTFYMLHNMFLTRSGIYIIIFSLENVDKQLNSFTHYLRFWIQSCMIHANGARIVIIGTNLGIFSNERRGENLKTKLLLVNHQIREIVEGLGISDTIVECRDRAYSSNGLTFFPILNSKMNNRQGQNTCVSELVQRTRAITLSDFHPGTETPMIQEQVSIPWLQILNELEQRPETHISFESVVEICQTFGVFGETCIRQMLLKFHRCKKILYYDQDFLRDRVILKPVWLVNCIKLLIWGQHLNGDKMNKANILHNEDTDLTRAWVHFQNTRIFKTKLLEYLWQGILSIDDQRFVTKLLERLMILCCCSHSPGGDNKPDTPSEYVIPSMLKEMKMSDDIALKPFKWKFSIYFKAHVPPSFFEFLLGHLLSHFRTYDQFKPTLFRHAFEIIASRTTIDSPKSKEIVAFQVVSPKILAETEKNTGVGGDPREIVINVQEQRMCPVIIGTVRGIVSRIQKWQFEHRIEPNFKVYGYNDNKEELVLSLSEVKKGLLDPQNDVIARREKGITIGGDLEVTNLLDTFGFWVDKDRGVGPFDFYKFDVKQRICEQFGSLRRPDREYKRIELHNDEKRKVQVDCCDTHLRWVLTWKPYDVDDARTKIWFASLTYQLTFEGIFKMLEENGVAEVTFLSHQTTDWWRRRWKLEMKEALNKSKLLVQIRKNNLPVTKALLDEYSWMREEVNNAVHKYEIHIFQI